MNTITIHDCGAIEEIRKIKICSFHTVVETKNFNETKPEEIILLAHPYGEIAEEVANKIKCYITDAGKNIGKRNLLGKEIELKFSCSITSELNQNTSQD